MISLHVDRRAGDDDTYIAISFAGEDDDVLTEMIYGVACMIVDMAREWQKANAYNDAVCDRMLADMCEAIHKETVNVWRRGSQSDGKLC